MAKAIENTKSLTNLDLSNTTIGDKGFGIIGEALKSNASITNINMSNCALTDKSGVLLSSIIRTHCTRRDDGRWALGLRGEVDASEIVKVHDKGIIIMHMEGNSFGDRTAEKLSICLQHDNWLLILNLRNNKIGLRGSLAFIDALKTNESLISLEVF